MKTSFKILCFAALAALATAPTMRADDNPPPAGERAGPRMKRFREKRLQQLDEKLHLTAEQKTKIQAIWDKAEADGRAVRNDAKLSADERKAKRRELMAATHEQVRGVLTPEQQKIFDDMPPPGRGAGGPPPDGGAN